MYTCDCPAGYSGEFCEETCSSVECQNGGVCINDQCQNGAECKWNGVSETCDCKPGFDGEHCEDEICIRNLCENGECIRNGLDETCLCEEGWFGSRCTSNNPCFEHKCPGRNEVCFLSPDDKRECVPDTIGFVSKANNYAAYCGLDRPTMRMQSRIDETGNNHTIHFEATEKNHRYIIKTHGCGFDPKCIAAWKKGTVKIYIRIL